MSRFFETIKCVDGEPHLLHFHNERMKLTMREVYGIESQIDLSEIISIPCDSIAGIIKIKVTYSKYIEKIEFEKYEIKEHRKVKIIINDHIEYKYKSTNRNELNSFLRAFPEYDDAIFVKNNHITDASYSNVIFENDGHWFTPENPLFLGVKRRFLIENKTITPKKIHIKDLGDFQKIGFINAMRDFEKIYTFALNHNLELELC